jgi:hypothetical protein
MSDEKPTQSEAETGARSEVPDVKEVVDKIADTAPSADPRDLDRTDALAGLKKIDGTILRLNK